MRRQRLSRMGIAASLNAALHVSANAVACASRGAAYFEKGECAEGKTTKEDSATSNGT